MTRKFPILLWFALYRRRYSGGSSHAHAGRFGLHAMEAGTLCLKHLLPFTEHQHRPEVGRAVGPVLLVLIPDFLKERRVENSVPAREHHIVRIVPQFPPEPPAQGYGKTLFPAIQGIFCQYWLHGFL